MEENGMAVENNIWQIDEASDNYLDDFQLGETVENNMIPVEDENVEIEKKSNTIRDFFHDFHNLLSMYK